MLEKQIEERLKKLLEGAGFKVLKLVTPGYSGAMDRMILWPTYCPRPPTFVELKKPGERLRPLQEAVANDWRKRGADVVPYLDRVSRVNEFCANMIRIARDEYDKNNAVRL